MIGFDQNNNDNEGTPFPDGTYDGNASCTDLYCVICGEGVQQVAFDGSTPTTLPTDPNRIQVSVLYGTVLPANG